MKVYVITNVWQCDDGNCGIDVQVCESIERAHNIMDNLVEAAKSDFNGMATETSNKYSHGDNSWSIWEEGEYCYNHIDISIVECEVQ